MLLKFNIALGVYGHCKVLGFGRNGGKPASVIDAIYGALTEAILDTMMRPNPCPRSLSPFLAFAGAQTYLMGTVSEMHSPKS